MGFAAGFAAGYKAVEDAKQNEIARKEKIEKDARALKEAESKAMKDSFDYVSKHNDSMSKLQENLASATNADEWNKANSDMANSAKAFSEFANYNMENGIVPKQAQKVYEQANLNNYEPLETVSIKNYNNEEVSVSIPKSMAENKDSISLMENGKIGIAQMGEDGKIAGYKPTDISPTKFKTEEEYGKGLIEVVGPDGKPISVSNKEYFDARKNGTPFTNYKNPVANNSTSVKIINEAKKDDYVTEIFDLAEQIRNGTKPYVPSEANLAQARLFRDNPKMADISKSLREEIDSEDISIKSLTRMKQNLDTLIKSGKYDNQYANFADVFTAKFTPESWSSKTPEQKEDVYKLLRSQGEMGDALAQYLKANSGTAASEKEAARNAVNLFGSTSDFASLKTKSETAGGFIEARKASLINKANNALDLGLVATGGKILNQYKKTEDSPSSKTTPSPDKVVKQKFDGVEYDTKVNEKGETLIYDPASSKWYKMDGGK